MSNEGEWTAETAARKIAKDWCSGKFRQDGGVVAGITPIIQDAINAALAPEREHHKLVCGVVEEKLVQLRDQLAAEREKVKLLEEELNEAVKLLKLEDIDAAIAKVKK